MSEQQLNPRIKWISVSNDNTWITLMCDDVSAATSVTLYGEGLLGCMTEISFRNVPKTFVVDLRDKLTELIDKTWPGKKKVVSPTLEEILRSVAADVTGGFDIDYPGYISKIMKACEVSK